MLLASTLVQLPEPQEKVHGQVSAAFGCCRLVSRGRCLRFAKTGAGGHADGRAAGTAAVADDGPADAPISPAARRPQLFETAQLRQKAPPREGASGRREVRKAHESREALEEEEVASQQGREGFEAARAGSDEEGVARQAGLGASRLAAADDVRGPASDIAQRALTA